MVAPAVEGIDLFNIAGRSISGWIPSLKTGTASHVRQLFCSQLEERLLLWLEYNPQVACYARGDIGPQFATTCRLPTPKNAPFAIGYTFEGKPHHYLPDVVSITTSMVDHPIAGVTASVPMITTGGIESISKNLAMEYAKEGIRFNTVAPGVVDTPLHKDNPKDFLRTLSPMGSISDAQEIVDAVVFLAEAPHITGEVLHVDGGSHLGKW